MFASQIKSAKSSQSWTSTQAIAPRTASTAGTQRTYGFPEQRPTGPRVKSPNRTSPGQQPLHIGPARDPAEQHASRTAERMLQLLGEDVSGAPLRSSPSMSSSAEPHVANDSPGAAERVVASSGQPLDEGVRDRMESCFRTDFSRVRVHVDGEAAASAAAMGAQAYTNGERIVFGDGRFQPGTRVGMRLLAHELAHVEQGRHGDARERATIRRYTEFAGAEQTAGKSLGWKHPAGTPLRVSDDGKMAAEDNGWGESLSKRAWTTPANLALSNAKLAAAGSKAKLSAKGNPISGAPPTNAKAAATTLQEVEPVKTVGTGPVELASDCGSACKEVMGSPAGGKDVSVMKSGNVETYGSPKDYHGGDPTTPEEWTEEVYKKEFGAGLSRDDAYKKYSALSPADKDKFDRKYGRNKYARPEVGQGITISTEKDAPGAHNLDPNTWNFHFAAAVMSSGVDYVTLENAAGWSPTGWIFFMYGPASKAQTFLEEQAATLTHGSDPSAAVVESEKVLDVAAIDGDAPLLVGETVVKLAKGTAMRVSSRKVDGGQIWLTVEVKSGPKAGTTGQIRSSLVK